MKKINFAIIIFPMLLAVTSSLIAGAFIISFQVKSENDNIVLEWSTKDEIDLDYYAVERRTPQSEWSRLPEKIYPNGSNFYRYIDRSAYKTTDNFYIYRIAIINRTSSEGIKETHSSEVSVRHHDVSGVKRTWGSIKAMFR
ncbi:MAG: hypothetical protein ACM34K_13520 [Bacillota bacterium]